MPLIRHNDFQLSFRRGKKNYKNEQIYLRR